MSEKFPTLRRRIVIGIGSLLAVFGLLPWSLGALADSKQDDVNSALRRCDPVFDEAAWADRLRVVQGYFPGFGAAASAGRSSNMYSVANGVAVCMIDQSPPPPILDGLLAFVDEHSDAITAASDDTRAEVERELHRLAQDRSLLELSSRWPAGGDGQGRSTAYLYLGDLAGAAELWQTDGVTDSRFGLASYTSGPLLCMAGDHGEGMRRLKARGQSFTEGANVWRDAVIGVWAECAARSGEASALDEALRDASPLVRKYYLARAEADAGREQEALKQLDWSEEEDSDLDAQILHVWLLLRLGRVSDAVAGLETDELSYILRKVGGTKPLDERIYNDIFFPMVDERRLGQIAAQLSEVRARLPVADREALADPIQSATASIHLWLAVESGVRWNDAQMTQRLEAARRAWPEWERPDAIEALFADLHGGLVSRALLATEHPDPPAPQDFAIALLNSIDFRTHDQLAAILGVRSMSVEHKLIRIARQEQDRSWRAHFLHLTLRITAAEALGEDARELREQLAAVRALVEGEPNPRLLRLSL